MIADIWGHTCYLGVQNSNTITDYNWSNQCRTTYSEQAESSTKSQTQIIIGQTGLQDKHTNERNDTIVDAPEGWISPAPLVSPRRISLLVRLYWYKSFSTEKLMCCYKPKKRKLGICLNKRQELKEYKVCMLKIATHWFYIYITSTIQFIDIIKINVNLFMIIVYLF